MTNEEKDFLTQEIERMTPRLMKLIRRKIDREDLVEDVFQEVFLDASMKVDKLMEHPNPDGWLVSAAHLECLAMLAFLKQEGDTFETPEDYQLFLRSAERDTIDDLLPPDTPLRDRTVLKLYYELRMTTTEIAETIGVKPNNANQILKRARANLKKVLLQGMLMALLKF